ncbi:MAG: hypothetical protein ACOVQM_01455 [Pirellula sp.]
MITILRNERWLRVEEQDEKSSKNSLSCVVEDYSFYENFAIRCGINQGFSVALWRYSSDQN